MKKIILSFFILTGLTQMNAQQNKFKVYSAEIGFGGFYYNKNNVENGGVTFVADLTTSINKNLFSSSILTGAEIGIVGGSTFNFNELKLSYGRELELQKWLKIELFGGIGYYIQTSENSEVKEGNSISYPIKFNIKFYFNKNFGMGINSNYSINNINNILSSNLIFHYKFN